MSTLRYDQLQTCRACPRLAMHLQQLRETHPDYHARPVACWGRRDARLLVVGLAPGMHGANRTGRPFTGDASGAFLFGALARAGFATAADPLQARLVNTRITNAVRCLPPGNRPTMAELRRCSDYLACELAELWRPRVRKTRCVLALGRMAHVAVGAALEQKLPPFRHGQSAELGYKLILLDSYHPSRQNTNTGRLTADMLDAVLDQARGHLYSERP